MNTRIETPTSLQFQWRSNPVPRFLGSGGLQTTDCRRSLRGLARRGRALTHGSLFVLLGLLVLLHGPEAVSSQNPSESVSPAYRTSRILVLYSYGFSLPAYQKINPAFLSVIQQAGMDSGNVFFECLDLLNLPEAHQRQSLANTLALKYAALDIGLIVTLHSQAQDFLLSEARGLFPNVPVVSWGILESLDQGERERWIIPLFTSPNAKGTLELALGLFPRTRRVVFVVGVSRIDRDLEIEAQEAFSKWEDRLQFEYTSSESVEEVLKRVAQLPEGSIVIYGNVFKDRTGRTFTPRDVGRMVAGRASVPVFALYDTLLDSGIVGGSLLSFEAEGARIGQLAIDVLRGKISRSEQPSPRIGPTVPMFDWRQIQRWGVRIGKLPEDSVFTHRPPSLLAQYRWQIAGIAGLMLAQGFLIASLLIARYRKGQAEQQLQKYQEQLKALASELTLAAEKERRAVAADLHDHIGHSLALARIQLDGVGGAKSELERNILVKDVSNILLTALQDTKGLISELSSLSMSEMGLGTAIGGWLEEQIEKRHGLETEFVERSGEAHGENIDENVKTLMFRNVRELLVNVVKHARATKVHVQLSVDDGMVKVAVEDDGVGFDPGALDTHAGKRGGFGLFSVRERMTDLGGSLDIRSEPGKGCRVTLSAPARKAWSFEKKNGRL